MKLGNPPNLSTTKIETFESAPISYTNGSAITNQSYNGVFTGKPDNITVTLVCVANDGGYLAGQTLPVTTNGIYDAISGAAVAYGVTLLSSADYQTFDLYIGTSGLAVMNPSAFTWLQLTPTKWRIVVKAQRFVIGDQPDITRVGLVPLEKKVVASGDADVQFNLQQYFNEYEDFQVVIKHAACATDATQIGLRTSSNGITFDSGASDYALIGTRVGATTEVHVNQDANYIQIAVGWATGVNANENLTGIINIHDANDPNYETKFELTTGGENQTPDKHRASGWAWRSSSEQTFAIQFLAASGNLSEGTIILYGKRKVA